MTRIIMHGCNGKMGQIIVDLAKKDADVDIVAGVDINDSVANDFPVFKSIAECDVEADVVIDFAAVGCIPTLMEYCSNKQLPVVVCTTGLSEEQVEMVNKASEKTAVLRSANMSLGVNTLFNVLENISGVLSEAGFDIEIVEKHHNQKIDAPSGTALALADVINNTLDNKYQYKFDRSQERQKRKNNEIGISAVRGGTIVGEHDIIFAGTDEVIEIRHTAYSKAIFAKGAISAAKYIAGKPAGMYDMRQVTAENM